MIFPDLNILVYAHNTAFERHKECSDWLMSMLNSPTKVCFSWHTIVGFVRITTTPRMFPESYSSKEALRAAANMIESPNAIILEPGPRHFSIMKHLIETSGISGPKISDAHLAALAIENGAVFASADRDFRLFDGLQLINPLVRVP